MRNLICFGLMLGMLLSGVYIGNIISPDNNIKECTPLLGLYNPYLDVISINVYDMSPDVAEKVLLHEFRHYLQKYHGWGYNELDAINYENTHKICKIGGLNE